MDLGVTGSSPVSHPPWDPLELSPAGCFVSKTDGVYSTIVAAAATLQIAEDGRSGGSDLPRSIVVTPLRRQAETRAPSRVSGEVLASAVTGFGRDGRPTNVRHVR